MNTIHTGSEEERNAAAIPSFKMVHKWRKEANLTINAPSQKSPPSDNICYLKLLD